MSLSMYQASVPVFVRVLTNLSAILDKAAKYAEAKKIDPSVLINARLAPDMFSLIKQVQLQSVDAPAQVISAYRDVTAAQQDLQRAVNDAETYANRVVPEAEGRAGSTCLPAGQLSRSFSPACPRSAL